LARFIAYLKKTTGRIDMNRFALVVIALATLAATSAWGSSADYYWDPNGSSSGIGGDGTWDTSNNRWRQDTETGTLTKWVDGCFAYFEGNGGTVSISGTRSFGYAYFSNDYTLTNGYLSVGGGIIETDYSTVTIQSILSGSSGITIAPNSSVVFNSGSDNTYTGETHLEHDAVLVVKQAKALGSSGSSSYTTVDYNADLQLDNSSGMSIAEPIKLSSNGRIYNVSGNNTLTGTITPTGSGTKCLYSAADTLTLSGNFDTVSSGSSNIGLALDGGGAIKISGNIPENSIGGTVWKYGTGTATFSGDNGYTAKTVIFNGVLRLDSSTALPGGIGNTGGASALELGGGVLGLGYEDFSRGLGTDTTQVKFTDDGGFAAYGSDRSVNLGGSAAKVTWASGSFVPSGKKLLLGAADADKTIDFCNPIDLNGGSRTVQVEDGSADIDAKLSGVLSGSGGGLTKTGSGTLVLGADNTYDGTTTISAGTLRLDASGAISSSATINVADGAVLDLQDKMSGYTIGSSQTLSGKGKVKLSNALTVNGTLDPAGSGRGTLTVEGDLTLGAASTTKMQVYGWDDGYYDLVSGTEATDESVQFGGTLAITFWSELTPGSMKLFDFDSYSGNLSLSCTDLPSGLRASFDASTGTLSVTEVPEPSTLLIAASVLMLGIGRASVRRRRVGGK
jgi:autotransporter-associated beta strand protein